MSSPTLLIAVCTLVAFLGGVHFVFRGARRCLLEDLLLGVRDFAASEHVIGNDEFSALAVDQARNAVCLISIADSRPRRVIPCRDIVSVELLEDGSSVTRSARMLQTGGVLVNWSGDAGDGDNARRIVLRLQVDDALSPVHDVVFLNTTAAKDGVHYQRVFSEALHWVGVIDMLIKRADADEQDAPSSTAGARPLMQAAVA